VGAARHVLTVPNGTGTVYSLCDNTVQWLLYVIRMYCFNFHIYIYLFVYLTMLSVAHHVALNDRMINEL
jgi:hypothetical protein